MKLTIPARPPFSFDQSLAFIRRFPPCQAETIAGERSVTAAVAVGGRAWPFTLTAGARGVVAEVPDGAPPELARRAADFLGTDDDLAALYAAAAGDPPFRALVRALHGLHHVRFLGLEEIAVHCVLMQRAPIAVATRLKSRFLDRFGLRVQVGGRTLRAMPELDELARLEAAEIAEAIGHRPKAERIATVVRAVAGLGEPFLRGARYAEARDALLAIPGIGPFSAAVILLRGLGRMDELPSFAICEREARAVYGRGWDGAAIARRYGDQIGYWSFYVKSGAARLPDA